MVVRQWVARVARLARQQRRPAAEWRPAVQRLAPLLALPRVVTRRAAQPVRALESVAPPAPLARQPRPEVRRLAPPLAPRVVTRREVAQPVLALEVRPAPPARQRRPEVQRLAPLLALPRVVTWGEVQRPAVARPARLELVLGRPAHPRREAPPVEAGLSEARRLASWLALGAGPAERPVAARPRVQLPSCR